MITKQTQTLDQRPGPTRPEDSGGKYWPDPARGSARARAENLNSSACVTHLA